MPLLQELVSESFSSGTRLADVPANSPVKLPEKEEAPKPAGSIFGVPKKAEPTGFTWGVPKKEEHTSSIVGVPM